MCKINAMVLFSPEKNIKKNLWYEGKNKTCYVIAHFKKSNFSLIYSYVIIISPELRMFQKNFYYF